MEVRSSVYILFISLYANIKEYIANMMTSDSTLNGSVVFLHKLKKFRPKKTDCFQVSMAHKRGEEGKNCSQFFFTSKAGGGSGTMFQSVTVTQSVSRGVQ